MDATAVLDEVQTTSETALQRLGSERALVAVTAATIDRATVIESAVEAEARAVATFEAWAQDEGHDRAREAFEAAAEREREHRDRAVGLAGDSDAELAADDGSDLDPAPDGLHEHLRGLEHTIDRVGAGLVGQPLVASRTLLQVINFFVNEGDSEAAGLFRELRAETDDQSTNGASLVVEYWEDAADRERAIAAANDVIAVAYDEYADRLSEMGVDPKPVC